MTAPLQAMVFDFDGTLVQSNRIKHDTLFEVARTLGPVDSQLRDILAKHPGEDRFGLYRQLLLRLHGTAPEASVTELCERYGQETVEAISKAPEIPGAESFLQKVSAKLPLYIDSATPQDSLRDTVLRRGWNPFFQGVYGRPASKTAILEMILMENGYSAERVLFVGDSLEDMKTARAHGCPFAGIAHEPGWLADFPPDVPVLSGYDAGQLTRIQGMEGFV